MVSRKHGGNPNEKTSFGNNMEYMEFFNILG